MMSGYKEIVIPEEILEWIFDDVEDYSPMDRTWKADNIILPLKERHTDTLIDTARHVYDRALEIMRKKNHDYTPDNDPIANFRMAEIIGVTTKERAIMVRLLDKIVRIANGLNKEYAVDDEKMQDNILDAINYLAILYYTIEGGDGGKE